MPNQPQMIPNAIPVHRPVQPSEENIELFRGMGFSRQEAIYALQVSNNNVQLATNLLLG